MCAVQVVTIALSLAEAREEISARQLDVLGTTEGKGTWVERSGHGRGKGNVG